VFLVLAVSMVGNWLRVFSIVNIGYFFGMGNRLVSDHLWLGWLIFAVLMVPVFFIARRLEPESADSASKPSNQSSVERHSGGVSWVAVVIALLAVSAGPAWSRIVTQGLPESKNVTMSMPENIDGWHGPLETAWNWRPRFAGATAERIAEFKRDNTSILIYSNIYLVQSQGAELIFYRNSVLGHWRRFAEDSTAEELVVPNAGRFLLTYGNSPYGEWVVLYRYMIGGEPVVGRVRAKFHQSLSTLRGNPEAGVIAFATPCIDSCAESISQLTVFVSELGDSATVSFRVEDQ
jgi:hypothetical protein